MRNANPKIHAEFVGQDFDDFLGEDGIAAEVHARAIKKVLVALLENAGLTQVEIARRMRTSRTQVRRLRDPENTSVTLVTLQRAADAAGHRLVLGFEALGASSRPGVPDERTATAEHL